MVDSIKSYLAYGILVWGILMVIFRIVLRIYTMSKIKELRGIGIDRILFFIPELAPIKRYKNSLENSTTLKKLYIYIRRYKFFFYIGLIYTMLVFYTWNLW